MLDIDKLIKGAMLSKNALETETYRAIKAKKLEAMTAKYAKKYDDNEEIKLLQKMVKERKESANIYSTNGRTDLADAELQQAAIIEKLLPEPVSETDIETFLEAKFPKGITNKEIGLANKTVREEFNGRPIDGQMVTNIIKKFLKQTEI